MKIKALEGIGNIKEGDIVEAIINKNGDAAVVFDAIIDNPTPIYWFYKGSHPRFEIVEEQETQKPSAEPQTARSFTLEELKQLKELFK